MNEDFFQTPLSEYEIEEWENRIFDHTENILRNENMKKFVENFSNGFEKFRLVMLTKIMNEGERELTMTIFKQMFDCTRNILKEPINMMQFIIFGAYKNGLIYEKKSLEYISAEYKKQHKHYSELGEDVFVQFLGYVCAGICIWNNYMKIKEMKETFDKEQIAYYKGHKNEFVENWHSQNETLMNCIVIDQAEAIINEK